MAEYRAVELTKAAREQGLTSTYNYEGQVYFLSGSKTLNVRQEIASGWISGDTNVKLLANG